MVKAISCWIVILTFLLIAKLLYAHSGLHEIKMTPDGFVPPELTISQGETVNFINTDPKNGHWPASNIHPTHGIYPEFDPRQAIAPSQSWKFKFIKSGKWRFHDHLNPQLSGTVIVEGNNIIQAQETKNQLGKFPNYQAYILRFYYLLFPAKLYKQLDSLNTIEISKDLSKLKYWLIILGGNQLMDKLVFDTDGGSKVDCHQEAHLIGRAAFELDKEKVFQKINYGCHSGFLHGAMEAFIQNQGNQNIIKAVAKLCSKFQTSFTKFECLHGIGHGLTAFTDYDIPEALNHCKLLPDDYGRRSCYGGVFMENIMVAEGKGAIAGHTSKWIGPDPYFPCNKVDQDPLVQYECYQMQTSRMLHLSSYNFNQIVPWCLSAPKEMVPVCFRSMGRDIAGQTLRNPDGIISNCQISPQEFFHECLTGAVNVVIDFWGEKVSDQPHQICQKLTSGPDKSFCYQLLGTRLKDIFTDHSKIEQVCKLSEPNFYQTCLGKENILKSAFPKSINPFYFSWRSSLLSLALNWLQNGQTISQTIKITFDGFEPDKLQVMPGTKVIFQNNDGKPHWPASDFHPTHDLYPEFDPQQPIEAGKSWEFEFKKVGTWNYHDHLNPHRKGGIVVVNQTDLGWIIFNLNQGLSNMENLLAKKSVSSLPEKSKNLPSKEEFLSLNRQDQLIFIRDFTSQENLKTVWDFIIDSFKNQEGNVEQAHDLAHLIGGLIYDYNGLDGLSFCTPDFAFGCFHGLLDKAFAKDISNLNQAEKACLKLGNTNSGPYASCIHGIGHGLASFYQSNELFPALKECDRLNSGQIFCYDGVMMEFARSAPANFYNQNNPLYPCDQIGEVYSAACGRNQPVVMFTRLQFDFNKVVGICAGSQNQAFKIACFDSLGFYSANASKGETEKIIQMCGSINDLDLQNRCLISAAGELVFQNIPGWENNYPKVCRSISIPQISTDCLNYVENLIRQYRT